MMPKKSYPLTARMLSKRHLDEDSWNYILQLSHILDFVQKQYYKMARFNKYLILHPTNPMLNTVMHHSLAPLWESLPLYGPGFAE